MLLLVVCSVLILGGVAAIARFTREPAGLRRLLAAPSLAIGQAGDAMDVRIRGTVEVLDGATLEGPLSGDRCVFAELTVREIGDALNTSTAIGRVLHHRSGGVPFVIRDGSGVAVIDPEGAHPELDVDHEARGSLAGTLAMQAIGLPRFGRAPTLEQERLIRPGDTIVVIGRGVLEPDPDPAATRGHYREGPPSRLRLSDSPHFRLHLIDPSREPKR